MQVCAHGTDIYLFGGRNDEAPCNVVYRFDTKTGTWSRPSVAGNIPPERDGHSACVIDDSMYVFGGYEESHSRYGQEVYKLDLKEMVWYLVMCSGEQPRYRDFHTATAIGDRQVTHNLSNGIDSECLGGLPSYEHLCHLSRYIAK